MIKRLRITKPAVGKGECSLTKGGACNVPCPKPEPPKCNSYGGWIENTGLGCVINENSSIKVNCGQTGVKQRYKIATNPTVCAELIKWDTCTGKPCPIDCVGSWSGWSAPNPMNHVVFNHIRKNIHHYYTSST